MCVCVCVCVCLYLSVSVSVSVSVCVCVCVCVCVSCVCVCFATFIGLFVEKCQKCNRIAFHLEEDPFLSRIFDNKDRGGLYDSTTSSSLIVALLVTSFDDF